MNGRAARRALSVVAGLALFVSCGHVGEQPRNEQLLTDLRAWIKAYERAWNSHDASAVAAFFTHDADMVMGNGPRIQGREAIAEWWARYFSSISDARAGTFEVESLRMLSADVALANVNTLTAGGGENGEGLPARRARGTWVLTSNDGQWLISSLRGLPAEGETRFEPGTDR